MSQMPRDFLGRGASVFLPDVRHAKAAYRYAARNTLISKVKVVSREGFEPSTH